MAKSVKDIASEIINVTNINNINNNQQQLKTLTTSLIVNESDDTRKQSTSSLLLAPPASPETSSRKTGVGTLPAGWLGVKIDLYQNGTSKKGSPTLALKLGVIPLATRKPVAMTAKMNSPLSYIFRYVDPDERQSKHWQAVEMYLKTHPKQGLRGSKFYLPNKQGLVENLVGFVYNISDTWHVDIIKNGELFDFQLIGQLSDNFVQNRGIATGYFAGVHSKGNWVSQKDLGI